MSDVTEKTLIGKLVRIVDNEWSEYTSEEGRKFYRNRRTDAVTWKPPRKSKTTRNSFPLAPAVEIIPATSTWSLPANPDDNVGGILRKGSLHISKMDDSKTKWLKCLAYLTDTHFVYRRKKRLDDAAGKISLATAAVSIRPGKKKQYKLTAMRDAIYFKCKKSVDAEAWFHATAAVIHNLNKSQRPRSVIEWGTLGISHPGIFIADLENHWEIINHDDGNDKGAVYSDFEKRILAEIIEKNKSANGLHKNLGIKSLFGSSVNKRKDSNGLPQNNLELNKSYVSKSKESLLSMTVIEEDEELIASDDEPNLSRVSIADELLNRPQELQKDCGRFNSDLERKAPGVNIKHCEKENNESDRRDSGTIDNGKTREIQFLAKISSQCKEVPAEIDTQMAVAEMKEPNTRWRPEIDPGDAFKNENNFSEKQSVCVKMPAPPGWVVRFDLKRREYLYENVANGDVWAVAKQQNNNFLFYYNVKSNRISWLLPSSPTQSGRNSIGAETSV